MLYFGHVVEHVMHWWESDVAIFIENGPLLHV